MDDKTHRPLDGVPGSLGRDDRLSRMLGEAMKKWPHMTISENPPGHCESYDGGVLGPGYVVGDDEHNDDSKPS